ncbi:MAG: hypothetical protein EBS75_02100 [Betaproteobacteria bacterium]|nr:hypothetical protein [Betaproteobacteria bacterium]
MTAGFHLLGREARPQARLLPAVIGIGLSLVASASIAQLKEASSTTTATAASTPAQASANQTVNAIASSSAEQTKAQSKDLKQVAVKPLISADELNKLLDEPLVRIIDIRSQQAYFTAHIPGALNAPYGSWRGPANNPGELPAIDKLTALIQGLGITPEQHIVVTSHGDDPTDFGSAARVYWTLKVLGLERLSLLNGGMKSWNQAKLLTDPGTVSVAKSRFSPRLNTAARSILAGTGIDNDTQVISFCNTGHWAATNWFAISEVLGHKHVKLYPGSMVEWTQQSEALPMDHVPGRLKGLLIDARLWAEKHL